MGKGRLSGARTEVTKMLKDTERNKSEITKSSYGCTFIRIRNKKPGAQRKHPVFNLFRCKEGRLLFLDSTHGASAGAGTAGDAGVSVDDVGGVALGDSAHGALLSTSAAGNASVANLICHS